MKTDKRDGASANSNLEEKLAGRFSAELGRAEGDYPGTAAAQGLRVGVEAPRSRWSRLAVPAAALTAVAALALIAAGLAWGPTAPGPGAGKGSGSTGPLSGCGASGPVAYAGGPSAACSIVPSAAVSLGPQIMPASIGGSPVLRAGTLPAMQLGSTFLLGGILARDTGCVAPSPWTVMYPPACGYWTVDGVKLGSQPGVLDDSLAGQQVVVRVMLSRAITDCYAPCPPTPFLYVTSVVWTVKGGPIPASS